MGKILIAPDSFKGTLSAGEVCDIIGSAFSDALDSVDIIKLPVADGGEGLCACIHNFLPGCFRRRTVSGVFGEPMTAEYLVTGDTAVIETASCAGLPLAGENKNPELATTRGVGELMLDAVSGGAKKILLGLGGSATNDCGTGLASAFGYRFTDSDGNTLDPIGKNLGKIAFIIPPENIPDFSLTAACDVKNPLYGETGAAYVFAPQKGADGDMVRRLDDGLKNIARVIEKDLGVHVSSIQGSGAAGGMGAGCAAFFGAELKPGIDIILDAAGFDEKAAQADLVITGEGRLDGQSVNGKVISGVAKRAYALGKKVIAICGSKGDGAENIKECGVSEMYFSCPAPESFEKIVRTCREDLYRAAKECAMRFKTQTGE